MKVSDETNRIRIHFSQKHGSPDPDQNVMDPQHCFGHQHLFPVITRGNHPRDRLVFREAGVVQHGHLQRLPHLTTKSVLERSVCFSRSLKAPHLVAIAVPVLSLFENQFPLIARGNHPRDRLVLREAGVVQHGHLQRFPHCDGGEPGQRRAASRSGRWASPSASLPSSSLVEPELERNFLTSGTGTVTCSKSRNRNRNLSKVGTGTGTVTFQKSEPELKPLKKLRFHNTVAEALSTQVLFFWGS